MQQNNIQTTKLETVQRNTKWLKKANPEDRLYFAYGSNINQKQMAIRCPGATPVAIAKCPKYKFVINERGVATILKQPNTDVFGILWVITDAHETALDRYEGIKVNLYTKEMTTVYVQNNQITTMVYLATEKNPGSPRPGYLEGILEGIQTFNGHNDWINDVETWLRI